MADDDGVVFPADQRGRRSTSATGRAIFADALRAVAPAAAKACERERRWRRHYLAHVRRLVEEGLHSAAAAKAIAAAGVRSVHRRLQFRRDGAEVPLESALDQPRASFFAQAVTGISKAGPAPLAVPYRGQVLTADALRRQLDRWEADGLVEPSFAQALWRVAANPDWLDLSDTRFALLGACAEMGPLPYLLRWRATVYAVDLPRAELWQRLLRLARAGNGTLVAPCAQPPAAGADEAALAAGAGADLTRDVPEIAAWLAGIEGPLVVGAYAYLDGAQHVRVAAAMDAIQARLAGARRDVALAMLATPTDVYAVPGAALAAAHARFAARGLAARAARLATFGRAFARNGSALANGALGGIVDALIAQQGPNYALAKRLQQWRAIVARETGTRVSIHVAPPALTRSVTKNRLLAAAYRAAPRFGAHPFEPATAAALMAALLVHDLRHPEAAANPALPLAHPLELLAGAAAHGGLWRMPYAARSALPAAALLGMIGR
jgi:hypothetical protein